MPWYYVKLPDNAFGWVMVKPKGVRIITVAKRKYAVMNGIKETQMMEHAIAEESAIICKKYGNIYRNILLKVDDNRNEFF